MAKLYNRVKVNTSTTGTGTVTLGSASSNAFLTFAEAGVSNADVVAYCLEEGNDFEIGIGTYTSAGTTLSRTTVTVSKIGGTQGTTKMTLAGAATVRIVARKEDLLSVSETQTANQIFAGPSSGAAATPAFRALVAADMPAGSVLQCLQNTYTANTNLTTDLQIDDTVPTSTEGTEVLSQAITCRNSSSKVLCLVEVWGSDDAAGAPDGIGAVLLRDGTAINAAYSSDSGNTGVDPRCVSMAFLDSPGSAAALTYSVRAGADASGNARLNGSSTARFFGGSSACTLTLMEIAG